MKSLLKLLIAVIVCACGVLTVLFEYFPSSAPTAFVEPYCGEPYRVVRVKVIGLYQDIRARLEKEDVKSVSESVSAQPEESETASSDAAESATSEQPESENPSVRTEPVNLSKAHWYSRERVGESRCAGKVVLGCVWSCEVEDSADFLMKAQRIYDGFGKKRDFVLFASHQGGGPDAARKFLAKAKVSFPVCEAGGLPCAQRIRGTPPYFYLIDKTGKLKYIGRSDKAVLTKMADLF